MSRPDLAQVLAARKSPAEPPVFEPRTGNVPLLLSEIRHALTAFVETGETKVIDLSSLPMSPPELAEFEGYLGRGEVHIDITASGPTEVVETAFPGVWRVTHKSSDTNVLGRYVEITTLPEIVKSQMPDVRAGLGRLNIRLDHDIDQEEVQ